MDDELAMDYADGRSYHNPPQPKPFVNKVVKAAVDARQAYIDQEAKLVSARQTLAMRLVDLTADELVEYAKLIN